MKSHMGQELPTKGNECMEAEVCPDDIRAYMRGRTGKAAARGNFGECRPHLVGAMEKASRSTQLAPMKQACARWIRVREKKMTHSKE